MLLFKWFAPSNTVTLSFLHAPLGKYAPTLVYYCVYFTSEKSNNRGSTKFHLHPRMVELQKLYAAISVSAGLLQLHPSVRDWKQL